jgi:hypothetical protein
MNSRSMLGVALGGLVLAGCVSWDHHYTDAVRVRNEIGDQCNALRDTWRADLAAGAPVEAVASDHQRMMTCVADFRQAQANVEQAWNAHAAAVAQLGRALGSAGDDFSAAGARYGQAAQSIQPPPAPPPPNPVGTLDDLYKPAPLPHGCIGEVPVSGPGLNPCPH